MEQKMKYFLNVRCKEIGKKLSFEIPEDVAEIIVRDLKFVGHQVGETEIWTTVEVDIED